VPLPPYPVLPAPYTWGVNGPELVLVPTLRSDVANAVSLLGNPPLFIGSASTTQSVTDLVVTPVTINNIITDPWQGFLVATATNWYFPLAGWYLVEGAVPGGGTGGAGTQTAGIGYVTNGAATAYANGGRVRIESSYVAHPTVAKLVQAVQVPSTDYAQLITYQTATTAQSTASTASKYPLLSCQWIASPSGTTGLAVPSNPAWPAPPSYVTSAFLNSSIRNVIEFLSYPPILEYTSSGSQSVPSATQTVVSILATATIDNYSAYSTSTRTFTAPAAGTWLLYGMIAWTEAGITTGTARAAALSVTSANYNGGTVITMWGNFEAPANASSTVTNTGHCSVVRRRLRLNAGDTVQLIAYQNDSSSNARTIGNIGNNITRLIGVWRAA
jgi:hypothetical protein